MHLLFHPSNDLSAILDLYRCTATRDLALQFADDNCIASGHRPQSTPDNRTAVINRESERKTK